MNNHHKIISLHLVLTQSMGGFFLKRAFHSNSAKGQLGYLFSWGNPDTEL